VRVRWTYTRGGTAPGPAGGALPQEAGTDEVVLRGGRIAAYTRTPDAATLRARAQALALAAAAATPPGAAAPGPGAGPGRPTPGRWLLAAGIALAGVVLLALGKRPADPEAHDVAAPAVDGGRAGRRRRRGTAVLPRG
jgi:hypothetical protein